MRVSNTIALSKTVLCCNYNRFKMQLYVLPGRGGEGNSATS